MLTKAGSISQHSVNHEQFKWHAKNKLSFIQSCCLSSSKKTALKKLANDTVSKLNTRNKRIYQVADSTLKCITAKQLLLPCVQPLTWLA
ncbi:hypothetical protein, partial [Paraglaciecola sp. 20A4]|uniref:hypothetical protein n=1 Tax=Paraglaciecola sp. 20A4 TaxID=2687288 RepID=UPI00197D72F3